MYEIQQRLEDAQSAVMPPYILYGYLYTLGPVRVAYLAVHVNSLKLQVICMYIATLAAGCFFLVGFCS